MASWEDKYLELSPEQFQALADSVQYTEVTIRHVLPDGSTFLEPLVVNLLGATTSEERAVTPIRYHIGGPVDHFVPGPTTFTVTGRVK